MNPIVLIAIGAALLAIIAGEGVALKGAHDTHVADQKLLVNMTGQRDEQAVGLRGCQNTTSHQQDQIDKGDAAARATIEVQHQKAAEAVAKNDSLAADNDRLFQELQDALDKRPTQVTLTQAYPTGWDPIVASAGDYIRSLQLAAAGASDAAVGGVPGSLPAGGPPTPGARSDSVAAAAAGAEARPSAQQQINLMNYISRLYRTAAKCEADKAALRASQKTGDVAP